MEWPEFHSPSVDDDAWCDSLLSLPETDMQQANSADWTFEENKLFENALAEVIPGSEGFFEKVAAIIPSKTIEQIKNHYQALVEDVELIESGVIPTPDYPSDVNDQKALLADAREGKKGKKERGSTSNAQARGTGSGQKRKKVPDNPPDVNDQKALLADAREGKKAKTERGSTSNEQARLTSSGQERKKGQPWTEQEHQLFLMGLQKYGRGDWRSISRYCVVSRTPTQVASHAQKYFRRQTNSTPIERRRPSIHDMHPINPYPTTFPDSRLPVQWEGNCSTALPNVGKQITPFP